MKTETIENLLNHVISECTQIDREARFDEMLDECYSFESIGGPFAHMSPASVLKECDPIAYRCGVNDWEDSQGWVEIDGNYYESDEVEKARESFVEDLESEASDLESDIETEEAEEDPDLEELKRMHARLNDLRANIAAAESYTF